MDSNGPGVTDMRVGRPVTAADIENLLKHLLPEVQAIEQFEASRKILGECYAVVVFIQFSILLGKTAFNFKSFSIAHFRISVSSSVSASISPSRYATMRQALLSSRRSHFRAVPNSFSTCSF